MKTIKEEQQHGLSASKYTAQLKEQLLGRADRDDIPKVAQDLGLAETGNSLLRFPVLRCTSYGVPCFVRAKIKSLCEIQWVIEFQLST